MKRFEFSIKGMRCSNCSNKIETIIKETENVYSCFINLIMEKGLMTIKENESDNIINSIKSKADNNGFKLDNFIQLVDSKFRTMNLILTSNATDEANNILNKQGIMNFEMKENWINIQYDPIIIKASQILNLFSEKKIEVQYENIFMKQMKEITSDSSEFSKIRLIFCLIMTLFLVLLSMQSSDSFLMDRIQSTCLNLYLILSITLSFSMIYIFGIQIFRDSIKKFINSRLLNMDSLITVGAISSMFLFLVNLGKFFTMYISANSIGMDKCLMDCSHSILTASTVVAISTIGTYLKTLERNNMKRNSQLLFSNEKFRIENKVIKVVPKNKNLTVFKDETELDVGLIEKDDIIKLSKGDFILLDYSIIQGEVEVIENLTFGSETPQLKCKGDLIKSGSQIFSGSCICTVLEVLEQTALTKITQEMNESLIKKNKLQISIDKWVSYFVPLIFIVSLITFLVWIIVLIFFPLSFVNLAFTLERAISVLVVSCPCAIGLAIPSVTIIALKLSIKHGILTKNIGVITELHKVKRIVFDKTGTLTELNKEVCIEYHDQKDFVDLPVFKIIHEIEKSQKHPIAELLFSYCSKKIESTNVFLDIKIQKEVSNGLKAEIQNFNNNKLSVLIGNRALIENESMIVIDNNTETSIKKSANSYVYFVVNNQLVMIFSFDTSSKIRNEAYSVINQLKQMKKEIFILSGDNKESVLETGNHLKISESNLLFEIDNYRKKDFFEELKNSRGKSLMIGDGLNDILSFSSADYGISFNAGSHLNLKASDIIFLKNDLNLILVLMKLSRWTYIFIWINILWASVYNIIMVPYSCGLFLFFTNKLMSPELSCIAMLCSSLLIVLTSNCLRLFNFKNQHLKQTKKAYSPFQDEVITIK